MAHTVLSHFVRWSIAFVALPLPHCFILGMVVYQILCIARFYTHCTVMFCTVATFRAVVTYVRQQMAVTRLHSTFKTVQYCFLFSKNCYYELYFSTSNARSKWDYMFENNNKKEAIRRHLLMCFDVFMKNKLIRKECFLIFWRVGVLW